MQITSAAPVLVSNALALVDLSQQEKYSLI